MNVTWSLIHVSFAHSSPSPPLPLLPLLPPLPQVLARTAMTKVDYSVVCGNMPRLFDRGVVFIQAHESLADRLPLILALLLQCLEASQLDCSRLKSSPKVCLPSL